MWYQQYPEEQTTEVQKSLVTSFNAKDYSVCDGITTLDVQGHTVLEVIRRVVLDQHPSKFQQVFKNAKRID